MTLAKNIKRNTMTKRARDHVKSDNKLLQIRHQSDWIVPDSRWVVYEGAEDVNRSKVNFFIRTPHYD
jgi:hypothetical protein